MVLNEIKNRIVKSRSGSAPVLSSVYSVRPPDRDQFHDAAETGETGSRLCRPMWEGLRPSGLGPRNLGATAPIQGHSPGIITRLRRWGEAATAHRAA